MAFYIKDTKQVDHIVSLSNDEGEVDILVDGELVMSITQDGKLHRYVCSSTLGLELDDKKRIKDGTPV